MITFREKERERQRKKLNEKQKRTTSINGNVIHILMLYVHYTDISTKIILLLAHKRAPLKRHLLEEKKNT